MKKFFSFVGKEFRHIFRDVRTMMILLLIPIILVILFGFALTTEVKDIRLGVVDPSHDDVTTRIVEKFGQNAYFDVTHSFSTVSDAERAFERGEVDVVIVFASNFSSDLLHTGNAQVQLLLDGSEPNQATSRNAYAQQVLVSFQQEMQEARGTLPPMTIVPVTHMLYNPQLKSEYNFVPGIMGLILMLICAMMTSIAIVREKESGTLEVLLASPLPPMTIIFSKLVPYFVVSCVDLAFILILSKYLLGMPFAGNFAVFLLISLLFIFVALSLGLLISTLVKTQLAAMLFSILLVVPSLYFSGMAFPIESMPEVFQRVSSIMPARWYVSAVRKLMIQGTDVQYVAQEAMVLGIMAVALITLSLVSFKKRL